MPGCLQRGERATCLCVQMGDPHVVTADGEVAPEGQLKWLSLLEESLVTQKQLQEMGRVGLRWDVMDWPGLAWDLM